MLAEEAVFLVGTSEEVSCKSSGVSPNRNPYQRTGFLTNPYRKYQMRIPYELLTELANSLLNDTVFEIVKGLVEIQHFTEKHLLQLREQLEIEQQSTSEVRVNE